jgi:hypothetical protein
MNQKLTMWLKKDHPTCLSFWKKYSLSIQRTGTSVTKDSNINLIDTFSWTWLKILLGLILIRGYVLHVWLPATRPGAKPERGTDQQWFVIMPSPTENKKLKNLCKREQRKAQNLLCFFIDYLPFPLQQMSAGNCKWHHHHHQTWWSCASITFAEFFAWCFCFLQQQSCMIGWANHDSKV